MPLAVLAALVALALVATPASAAGQFGDLSGGAFQILAPGEEGGLLFTLLHRSGCALRRPHALAGDVTTSALEEDFLSEKFGVQGPVLRTEDTGAPALKSSATATTSRTSSAPRAPT